MEASGAPEGSDTTKREVAVPKPIGWHVFVDQADGRQTQYPAEAVNR
jgi:hypothetical protein